MTAPIEELRDAERASRVTGRRLLLVGGEAAALLLAFAVLAAAALRRDLEGARRRLQLGGARRWQLGLLTGVETAVVAIVGTALGWCAGIAAAAIAASSAGAPVGAVLRESVLSGTGIAIAVGAALASWAVLAAAVTASRSGGGRVRMLDVLAVAAVVVVGVALVAGRGGQLSGSRPARARPRSCCSCRRCSPSRQPWPPHASSGRRCGSSSASARRRLALRLAAVSLSRGRGTASIAAAFLVVSFSLALLAEAYRTTLARGERDAAAFAVPLDFVIKEDLRRLVPVQDAAPLARFGSLGPGVRAEPVLRLTGGAGRVEGVSGVTLLGLDADALPRLRGLARRSGTGCRDPA